MRRRCGGFTYLALVMLLAIIGLVGAATLRIEAITQRARAEQELLAIGAAFSQALDSYAAATPPGGSPYPPGLAELLRDPRSPAPRRHLRRIFVDPVTGRAEWGIEYVGGGETGILAIYSLSDAVPLKQASFPSRFAHFENKLHLSEWRFTGSAYQAAPAQQAPAKQPSVGASAEVARPETQQPQDGEVDDASQGDDAQERDDTQ